MPINILKSDFLWKKQTTILASLCHIYAYIIKKTDFFENNYWQIYY